MNKSVAIGVAVFIMSYLLLRYLLRGKSAYDEEYERIVNSPDHQVKSQHDY